MSEDVAAVSTDVRGDRRREAVFYAIVVLVAAAVLVPAVRLWRADPRVPFTDSGDSLFTAALVKGLVDHGSWIVNPSIGAPGGMQLQDFPTSDSLHMVSMWALAKVTGSWAAGLNLYYLLGFPLAALVMAYVLRRMGASRAPAFVAAVLFGFLPFHFLRNEVHLFLASYWVIPLTLLVCWRLYAAPGPRDGDDDADPADPGGRALGWSSIAMAAVVACSGVYFAYFSCFFIVVAGVAGALRRRSWRSLWRPALLVAMIALTVAVNVIPTLLYRSGAGTDGVASLRYPAEAVIYGLKLDQMLVPTSQYFIPGVAEAKRKLNDKINDFGPIWGATNDHAWLGIAASVGFLFLLGRLLFRSFRVLASQQSRAGPLDLLAALAVGGTLFATMGGFGAILAEFVFSAIRAYDRISVFIAMFSLAALAIVAGGASKWRRDRRNLAAGILAVVLALGLLDQVGSAKAINLIAVRERFDARAGFVADLESRLPSSAMVFQLPYVEFPEAGAVGAVGGYDHLRAYLVSDTLRWSFGTMRGRSGDAWYHSVAALPSRAMVKELRREGFAAIWIDRGGYADSAASLEDGLRSVVKGPAMTSADGRIAVYLLTP